jgi:hypothetical protein
MRASFKRPLTLRAGPYMTRLESAADAAWLPLCDSLLGVWECSVSTLLRSGGDRTARGPDGGGERYLSGEAPQFGGLLLQGIDAGGNQDAHLGDNQWE